ncbi:MAG: type IV pilus secretin PilQ [Epsilonproteobacteria bacterium]|nr:type IV pilus secretin PilQ [Campylobacterota bacterium]
MNKRLRFSYKIVICFLLIGLFSVKAYSEETENRAIIGASQVIRSTQTDSSKLYGITVFDSLNRTRIVLIGKKLKSRWFILKRGNKVAVDLVGIRHFYNDKNDIKQLNMRNTKYVRYAFRKRGRMRFFRMVFAFNRTVKSVHFSNKSAETEFKITFKNNKLRQNTIKEILFLSKKRYEQIAVRASRIDGWNKTIKNRDIKIVIRNSKFAKNVTFNRNVSDRSKIISQITTAQNGTTSVINIKLKKHSFVHFSSDSTHIYITLVNAKKSIKAVILNSRKIRKASKYTGKPVSVNVKNADVIDLLRMIANISKLNIIADDSVKGKITIQVKNIPWDQLLDLILEQKGLEKERIGNVIRIAPIGVMERQSRQRLAAIKAKEHLSVIEKPITGTIPLSYIKAGKAVSIIQKIVYAGSSKGNGFIVADESNNAILYSETKKNVMEIKRVIKMIDKRKPVIEIDARIVEVTKTNERDFGIQWGGNFNNNISNNTTMISLGGGSTGTNSLGGAVPNSDNFVVNLPGANPLGNIGLAIGNVSRTYNLSLKLSLGEINGYTKTISTPKIITLDNEKGTIKQGVQIPYIIAGTNGGPPTTDFKQANLELDVTPHITASGTILLDIKATKDTPTIVPGSTATAINTNQVVSNVIVKNNSTIVLGGIFSKTDKSSSSGIPGLSRIPFFGWLFKNKSESHPRNELLIFITTHVVKN